MNITDINIEMSKNCGNLGKLIKSNFIKQFIYNKPSGYLTHTYALLLGKFNSLNNAILLLTSHMRGEEANILVRSLLETTLLILLLMKYPSEDIAKLIYFSGSHDLHKNMLKPKIKNRLQGNISYEQALKKHQPLENEYHKSLGQYKNVRGKLFPKIIFNDKKYILGLSNRQIATLVNLEDLYDYIYWQLCDISHPSLSGLHSRVRIVEDGYDVSLEKTPEEVSSALFYTLDISISLLQQFYKKKKGIVQKYKRTRDILEQALLASKPEL